MHLNVISFIAIALAPHFAITTPVASPSGSDGRDYTSSSSSSSHDESLAAGAATGYVGHDWLDHDPHHGGASGDLNLEGIPRDCRIAKRVNAALQPKADCFYSNEQVNKGPEFLYYVIRITPTGQNSYGWAKGVTDNIKRSCKWADIASFEGDDKYHSHDEDFGKQREIRGMTFRGLEVTVPLTKREPVEDVGSCVQTAIRKASCGVNIEFEKGSCYEK